jgi:hypothetical protein
MEVTLADMSSCNNGFAKLQRLYLSQRNNLTRIIDTRKLEHPRHRPKLLTQLGSVPAEAFPITMKLSAAKKI